MIKVRGVNCWNFRGAGEILNIGRNTLFKILRERNILTNANRPSSAEYTKYFLCDTTSHNGFTQVTTYIKEEGIKWLRVFLADIPRKEVPPEKSLIDLDDIL